MSTVQVQVGGRSVPVQVQSSGVARASQAVRDGIDAVEAQQATSIAAVVAQGVTTSAVVVAAGAASVAAAEAAADEAATYADLLDGATFEAEVSVDGYAVVVNLVKDAIQYPVFGLNDQFQFDCPGGFSRNRAVTVRHVVLMGQSNMAADQAFEIVSTAATGWGNKTFQRGPNTWVPDDNELTPEDRADAGFILAPLFEGQTVLTFEVESRATGLADTLKALMTGRGRNAVPLADGDFFIVTSTALGSRRLTDIGPDDETSEGLYITALDDIARAKAAVESLGHTYEFAGVVVDQGEKEGDLKLTNAGSVLTPLNLIAGYKAKAIELAEAIDTDVRALTSQTQPVLTFVMPANSNLWTPTAWQQAAEDCPLIQLIGPRYHCQSAMLYVKGDTSSAIHYSADAHRADLAELTARAIHRVNVLGEHHSPPLAVSARKISSTSVAVKVNTRFPLVVDTTLVPPCYDFGFTLYAGTIDSPTGAVIPTAIAIQGDEVILTVPSVPASGFVRIGVNSLCELGVTMTVTARAAATADTDAGTRFKLTVAGDQSAVLAPLLRDGVFYVYGDGPSSGVCREIEVTGGNTLFYMRDDEERDDGGLIPFDVGDVLTFGRTNSYTNVRNTDPAMSRSAHVNGPQAGLYPPLYGWLMQHAGITITGA